MDILHPESSAWLTANPANKQCAIGHGAFSDADVCGYHFLALTLGNDVLLEPVRLNVLECMLPAARKLRNLIGTTKSKKLQQS